MNKFIEFRCCSDIVRKTINITLLEEEKSKLHAAFTIYYTEGLNELFHKIDPHNLRILTADGKSTRDVYLKVHWTKWHELATHNEYANEHLHAIRYYLLASQAYEKHGCQDTCVL